MASCGWWGQRGGRKSPIREPRRARPGRAAAQGMGRQKLPCEVTAGPCNRCSGLLELKPTERWPSSHSRDVQPLHLAARRADNSRPGAHAGSIPLASAVPAHIAIDYLAPGGAGGRAQRQQRRPCRGGGGRGPAVGLAGASRGRVCLPNRACFSCHLLSTSGLAASAAAASRATVRSALVRALPRYAIPCQPII